MPKSVIKTCSISKRLLYSLLRRGFEDFLVFSNASALDDEAIREVKIDVYGRPVTANAKLQVGVSGEVLAVRN